VFTLHYIANPTGPFAPDSGGGSAAPAAAAAASPATSPAASLYNGGTVSSGLTILDSGLSSGSTNLPSWLSGRLQSILTSPPVTKAIQNALQNPEILQVIDQIAANFQHHDDALDGLLEESGLD
jgi:hypothetical protein